MTIEHLDPLALHLAALFTPRSLQYPPAWIGHMPFAYWLAARFRPRTLVELGTHSGNSYFAFCQAVAEHHLPTRCYAVDTWRGDPHAGYYPETIYQSVRDHNHAHYARFSHLLRMTFDEARERLPDGSIDLLHIDGQHHYEAVRHDYESWRPKLAPEALILFHDTQVRERDFGVWRLWEELTASHPHHFEFLHSHGLGVLWHGQTPPPPPLAWLDPAAPERTFLQAYFARLGQRLLEHFEARHKAEALYDALRERETTLDDLRAALQTTREELERTRSWLDALQHSTSWRITAPLRDLSRRLRPLEHFLHRTLPEALRRGGGWGGALRKSLHILRHEGPQGLLVRARWHAPFSETAEPASPPAEHPLSERDLVERRLRVVPYYPDPALDTAPPVPTEQRIGIHLHLYYPELRDEFLERLALIPQPFDLYVSLPEGHDPHALAAEFRQRLPQLRELHLAAVPNRGRDLAPFLLTFGRQLATYDIVGHFHTKKTPHRPELAQWRRTLLDLLFGPPGSSGARLSHYFRLLQERARILYPERPHHYLLDECGWGDDRGIAAELLSTHTSYHVDDFPAIEFPAGSMFWICGEALRPLLALPLRLEDFPAEPIPEDGTLMHALERLILILTLEVPGEALRLHQGDSVRDYRHYENPQDYRERIPQPDVRVLAYYLPQFHLTPENDRWHGPGFTEWTKVRAAQPLYQGHDQQRIPHPDLGYYLLDGPETLARQAEMMHRAGLAGLIFYHYWFHGRLILEKPAQTLLAHPQIDLPYCFCWANEHWTRRWDGNERELLLEQTYSPEDDRAFIRYLIPFFRDPRYLRLEGRPLLFIYRPASLPDPRGTLARWAEECAAAGLPAPYVVATLTRGATHPRDYGMDAGLERVLHDWTAGAVAPITERLHAYQPLRGSVLPYEAVARHYAEQDPQQPDAPLFRSIVPRWDNTARYGPDAYLLHGSTPALFQSWLETLIAQARRHPPERRLIVVNAWNEWAEGAHLEPDTRYGYAYLNSIGRALAGIPYSSELNPQAPIPPDTHLHLSIPPYLRAQLERDPDLARRFTAALERSSVLERCRVTLDAPLTPRIPCTPRPESPHYHLEFRQLALFAPDVLEKLLATACATGLSVIPNAYGLARERLILAEENGGVAESDAYHSPLLLTPPSVRTQGYRGIRMRTDAWVYRTEAAIYPLEERPRVTTLIRYHRGAALAELRNALGCLAAMVDVRPTPLIAAQDLDEAQTRAVQALLAEFDWDPEFPPCILPYCSTPEHPDLRATLLFDSLRHVETRYLGFLDYDDLLLPWAYRHLIERLQQSGKAVAFGRVYRTEYHARTQRLLKRERAFEYGRTYEDFLRCNHAPLHSFLIDTTRIELGALTYDPEQRYMEDYLLTLQLLTPDNADWEGLRQNCYLGDYLHALDRPHTLALTDPAQRRALLADPLYQRCQRRIDELRALCRRRHGLTS